MAKKRIPKEIIKMVKAYAERLAKEDKIPIDRIILFGSHAKGDFHKGSDIDVCIVSPKFKNGVEALQFLWLKRNKKEIMAGLEPVGFSVKDFKEGSSLIQEIKKTGVTL